MFWILVEIKTFFHNQQQQRQSNVIIGEIECEWNKQKQTNKIAFTDPIYNSSNHHHQCWSINVNYNYLYLRISGRGRKNSVAGGVGVGVGWK